MPLVGTLKSAALQNQTALTVVSAMANIERCMLRREAVATNEVRDVLQRAASLLCSADGDQVAIVAHFVRMPFVAFTKQSIKLGLTLWMGVIKENPRMEPKILVEIVENWITTVHSKLGIFSERMK